MNYIIFGSVYSVITLCVISVLYVLTAIAVKLSKEKFARICAVVNIVAHIFLVLLLIYLKATTEEMLFVLVACVAFSLVVRTLKGEK